MQHWVIKNAKIENEDDKDVLVDKSESVSMRMATMHYTPEKGNVNHI